MGRGDGDAEMMGWIWNLPIDIPIGNWRPKQYNLAMPRNKQVDVYIANAPPFARPILIKLRNLFHQACPEICETIKWGMPNFEHQGIVGHIAAFNHHVSYHFWHSKLLPDPDHVFPRDADGKRDIRLTDVSLLPDDRLLLAYIKRAVALNKAGIKRKPKPPKKAAPLKAPRPLSVAIKGNSKAAATFKSLSTSCRNEYIEWFTDAKQETTRARRLATIIQWLEQGKSRNWKYEKK